MIESFFFSVKKRILTYFSIGSHCQQLKLSGAGRRLTRLTINNKKKKRQPEGKRSFNSEQMSPLNPSSDSTAFRCRSFRRKSTEMRPRRGASGAQLLVIAWGAQTIRSPRRKFAHRSVIPCPSFKFNSIKLNHLILWI